MRRVIGDAGWPVTLHCAESVYSVEVNLDSVDTVTKPAAPQEK
jgi:hypothetical protein